MSRPRSAWAPPARDGVSPSCLVTPSGPWPSMLDFLAERLPLVPRDDWLRRLQRGDVLNAEGHPIAPEAPFSAQTRLWYWRQLPAEPRIPFEATVLFQDDWLVVADKPHFLPMTPKGRYLQETLLVRLKRQLGLDTLVPIHRLDRETAGVVVFSIQPATRHAYQSLFRDRQVHKVYEAIAPWHDRLVLPSRISSRLEEDPASFMQMRTVPGTPNAHTHLALVERRSGWARYRLTPETGRKHQLRAQLSALGIPIAGDRIYPSLWAEPPAEAMPDYHHPLQLLARHLAFTDPVTGAPRAFTSRRELSWPAADLSTYDDHSPGR